MACHFSWHRRVRALCTLASGCTAELMPSASIVQSSALPCLTAQHSVLALLPEAPLSGDASRRALHHACSTRCAMSLPSEHTSVQSRKALCPCSCSRQQ